MPNTSLITAAEFDDEVALRVLGDTRISAFTGQAMASGTPEDQLPAYSALGTLVDISDDLSLLQGISVLDRNKNSRQILYQGAVLKISNPRHLFFSDVFRVTATDTQDVLVSLSGEVGWAGPETASSIALGEVPQTFADGGFCIGGSLTYITIGRIAAVYRVVAGVNLMGRRGQLVPQRNNVTGLVLKRQIICTSLQTVTALSGETYAVAKLWGGGGGTETSGSDKAIGGVGGFTRQSFAFTVGNTITLLPGGGGPDLSGTVAGYGGQKGTGSRAGGGGSFIWTGTVTPTASLDAGLLAVAGGGGGGKVISAGVAERGGHGNAASAGQSNHQGLNGDSTHSGGGGGYRGGSWSTGAGLGGSGFLSTPGNGEILTQTGGLPAGPNVNPGAGDIDWQQGYGGPGQPGLIVVNIYGP